MTDAKEFEGFGPAITPIDRMRAIKEEFKEFDESGDKLISKDEWTKMMKKKGFDIIPKKVRIL